MMSVWLGFACASPLAGQTNMRTLPASNGTSSAVTTLQTVTGQVISATSGMPVFRALVKLNDRAVLTDHEGKFEFREFSASQMNNLQVSKPGYYASAESNDSGALLLRTNQLASAIEVRLYPEALLTGTVARPDGTPLPHISVNARRSVYNDQVHRWMGGGQTMTDSHGNFRIAVPPGDYKLQTGYAPRVAGIAEAVLPLTIPASSEGNASDTIHLFSGSQEHFDLTPPLSRTYAVSVALDSSLERGFPMITARSNTGLTIPVSQSGRAAGPGQMRLELPTGTFTLIATQNNQEGMRYGEVSVTVTDHDVDGVVLHMGVVSPIPVELVTSSNATSDKTPPDVHQFGLTLESTADYGQGEGASLGLMPVREPVFGFHAPPGIYRLQSRGMGAWFIESASYGTTDLLTKDLNVSSGASGDTIRLTVSDQTGSLNGVATLNGLPGACWIYLIPSGPSATGFFIAHSSYDGTYTAGNLPPGSYRVIAFEQRHSANYRDPQALDKFATRVGAVTIQAGNKASLDLNAVSVKEMVP